MEAYRGIKVPVSLKLTRGAYNWRNGIVQFALAKLGKEGFEKTHSDMNEWLKEGSQGPFCGVSL